MMRIKKVIENQAAIFMKRREGWGEVERRMSAVIIIFRFNFVNNSTVCKYLWNEKKRMQKYRSLVQEEEHTYWYQNDKLPLISFQIHFGRYISDESSFPKRPKTSSENNQRGVLNVRSCYPNENHVIPNKFSHQCTNSSFGLHMFWGNFEGESGSSSRRNLVLQVHS